MIVGSSLAKLYVNTPIPWLHSRNYAGVLDATIAGEVKGNPMRKKLYILLIAIVAQPAYAHELSGEDGLLNQLVHQLTAVHHLPIALVLVAVIALVTHRRAVAKRNR